MKYIPLSQSEEKEILSSLGYGSIEDLFSSEGTNLPFASLNDYPPAQSEIELRKTFKDFASLSSSVSTNFAGCGVYQHSIPSIVPFIQSRSEFATAYTPYQAEISQGLLQAIYEFQSISCSLTECELSNASVYDGATALAEGVLMALRIKKKSSKKILISKALHPHYIAVIKTYCAHFLDRLDFIDLDGEQTSHKDLIKKLPTADIVVTQSPNFYGVIERYDLMGSSIKNHDALWVTSTMEPFSWGVLRGPGAFGADIVTAEGQSFGNAPYMGGSSFGFFATRNEFLRNLPGRLVGETVDRLGRRSYTLTFSTREQFIRRDKATSNICTNQNLNMLAGLIHLCVLGKSGLKEVAERILNQTAELKSSLGSQGLKVSALSHFNEFSVTLNSRASEAIAASARDGWICGVDLGQFDPGLANKLLITVNETMTSADFDKLINHLKKYA